MGLVAPATVLWQPHPGPQTRFIAASEFELLYGGAAGGGKSDALLFGMLRQTDKPGYRGLILRHTFPELVELMDRAHGAFPLLGGKWSAEQKRYTFGSGATIEFGYCSNWKDVQRYQGQQFSEIGFDEIGNLAEERIWLFLMSRCRSGGPGIRPHMRSTANPGGPGHAWLRRRFIDTCGINGMRVYVEPFTKLTRRFIPARLSDNPTLMENNPTYEAQLRALPDLLRRQLLEGDWDAGTGLALGELGRHHFCDPFEPPEHWIQFGAFDWGFNHPFSFGWYTTDSDGTVYKIDTVTGRRLLPDQIAERVENRVPIDDLRYIACGLDIWNEQRARGENTPQIAETLMGRGWRCTRANTNRVNGLNNFREYITGDPPGFYLMDTPGNRKAFEQLTSIVTDPDDPEDALKVDADSDTGEGGDDIYDETRYGLASRPKRARVLEEEPPEEQYDPEFDKLAKASEKAAARRHRLITRAMKRGRRKR